MTDDERICLEVEYNIESDSLVEPRTTKNITRQLTKISEPVNVATPPLPTCPLLKEGAQSSREKFIVQSPVYSRDPYPARSPTHTLSLLLHSPQTLL